MGNFNRIINSPLGMLIYNNHDYIGQILRDHGEWESYAVDLWKTFLEPDMTVLDIGANIGTHTLALSRIVGDNGTVLAFEPQRLIYYMLAGVVALNSLTNVWCFQKAVSDEEGTIFVPELDMEQNYNFGGFSLAEPLRGAPRILGGETVPVISIDNLNLQKCHFIKVDVEGMEENVLRGAQKTINKYSPIMYVENNRPNNSNSLIHFIRNLGYRMYWDRDENMLCLPEGVSIQVSHLKEV
ncbi:FkbM family methyltransferase [Bacillus cereus group sp. BfR-BA-01380]|uniref:FkbM family methyltransferase n=1 Tax=Bacillus cereus group sp. BfR-BA-01380 TaxID=2920324 RepID=UPI001F55C59D|nr:FkbM family methyltransferase [Bacillus cereus group sp. BfR-BA-01380]